MDTAQPLYKIVYANGKVNSVIKKLFADGNGMSGGCLRD
jgi:hypothetical protein